ncbi:MAG: SDR family oxidoreductase [Bacteroidales bacterium]|nr:SDR family oxidoreductase [Bacteroidales bacterium]
MNNKVVVITGASSGIGRALAEGYAARGDTVVLAARSEDKLASLEESIRARASGTLTVTTDVTRQEDCRVVIAETMERFGRIDVLINNAGVSMRALFGDTDLTVLHRLMDVNFWGAVYCTKYALPHLLESRGSVVGVSSIAGFKGLPGRSGYSASKFALQGFLEVLRIEYLKKGLHVLIACPGFTATNIRFTALGPDGGLQGESPRDEASMMSPQQVASHIIRSVEQRRRMLILTSQGKWTVRLNKFFPYWMDHMVYRHMSREPGSPFT